jgi:hypothetical protein
MNTASLIANYQDLSSQKGAINEKLDLIESKFIRAETPIYKKRMLGIYNKVSVDHALTLKNILTNITYGPVAIHAASLIDNNKKYVGSFLYYKHKPSASFEYEVSVLVTSYKDEYGVDVTRIYKTSENCEKFTHAISEDVPLHWLACIDEEVTRGHETLLATVKERGLHAVEESLQLLAFLAPNADLAPFGDIHTAITDYYDIREKLEGNGDYYWVHPAATAAPAFDTPRLVEQLREATEWYSGNGLHDLRDSDWQCVQGLLQKALVALQGAC